MVSAKITSLPLGVGATGVMDVGRNGVGLACMNKLGTREVTRRHQNFNNSRFDLAGEQAERKNAGKGFIGHIVPINFDGSSSAINTSGRCKEPGKTITLVSDLNELNQYFQNQNCSRTKLLTAPIATPKSFCNVKDQSVLSTGFNNKKKLRNLEEINSPESLALQNGIKRPRLQKPFYTDFLKPILGLDQVRKTAQGDHDEENSGVQSNYTRNGNESFSQNEMRFLRSVSAPLSPTLKFITSKENVVNRSRSGSAGWIQGSNEIARVGTDSSMNVFNENSLYRFSPEKSRVGRFYEDKMPNHSEMVRVIGHRETSDILMSEDFDESHRSDLRSPLEERGFRQMIRSEAERAGSSIIRCDNHDEGIQSGGEIDIFNLRNKSCHKGKIVFNSENIENPKSRLIEEGGSGLLKYDDHVLGRPIYIADSPHKFVADFLKGKDFDSIGINLLIEWEGILSEKIEATLALEEKSKKIKREIDINSWLLSSKNDDGSSRLLDENEIEGDVEKELLEINKLNVYKFLREHDKLLRKLSINNKAKNLIKDDNFNHEKATEENEQQHQRKKLDDLKKLIKFKEDILFGMLGFFEIKLEQGGGEVFVEKYYDELLKQIGIFKSSLKSKRNSFKKVEGKKLEGSGFEKNNLNDIRFEDFDTTNAEGDLEGSLKALKKLLEINRSLKEEVAKSYSDRNKLIGALQILLRRREGITSNLESKKQEIIELINSMTLNNLSQDIRRAGEGGKSNYRDEDGLDEEGTLIDAVKLKMIRYGE
ncbi:hypothetical protein BY996DRAFT_8323047 [Phakopsora pachyrhizi]|nr:hypothetical protein BY996DRAFT_8323047 [Phakopsora pachyrhizi]